MSKLEIRIKRAYDAPAKIDGYRVLVERLWPRGVKKEDAAIDEWMKEIAPSNELRKKFHGHPEKWDEFRKQYFADLKDNPFVPDLIAKAHKGCVTLVYAAKGHDLFASVQGTLKIDTDRAVIDRLWNRYVAAWFEEGKDDPKLCLLRFDPSEAEIWEDASSLVAGVKMFLGMGVPKKDYKDSVAHVSMK